MFSTHINAYTYTCSHAHRHMRSCMLTHICPSHTQTHSRVLTCVSTAGPPAGPVGNPFTGSPPGRQRSGARVLFQKGRQVSRVKGHSVSCRNVPSLTHHRQRWLYDSRKPNHFLKRVATTFGVFAVVPTRGARRLLRMTCVFLSTLSRLMITESVPVLLKTLLRAAFALCVFSACA